MCTSFTIIAKDGSPIYGRTMEWGGFDLQSDLVLVPRNTPFTSALGRGRQGMTWINAFGFLGINAKGMPVVTDGMNETGLTVGVLYLPGFTEYQTASDAEAGSSVNNVDLAGYILSRFRYVDEVKAALPNLRVVHNPDMDKEFGAPVPLHWTITDSHGDSLVVEYVGGELKMYDNKIRVMTNSPGFDWHLINLRNYANLRAEDMPNDAEINGVSLHPIGVGSGMLGLPGDSTPPSRFVRAVAFTQTMLPVDDAETGVREAARILHNFDIPNGLVREGGSPDHLITGVTQYTAIGDIRNRRYYYWTQYNQRIRMVDLTKLDFSGDRVLSSPLDEQRVEDVRDRTGEFR